MFANKLKYCRLIVLYRRSVVRTAESSMTKARASNQYCLDQLLLKILGRLIVDVFVNVLLLVLELWGDAIFPKTNTIPYKKILAQTIPYK